MQWPANRRDGLGFNPYRYNGNNMLFKQLGPTSGRYNIFVSAEHARTAGSPSGYSAGGAYVMPIKTGGMSSWQSQIAWTGAGDVLSGGPMDGTGAITFTETGDVSLIIALAGTGTATFAGAGSVALTIGMAGEGLITFAGSGGLSMIIPIEASGSFAFTGAGDVRGYLGLVGEFTPFTELSPQSLATAVWQELNSNGEEFGTVVTRTDKNAKLAVALSA